MLCMHSVVGLYKIGLHNFHSPWVQIKHRLEYVDNEIMDLSLLHMMKSISYMGYRVASSSNHV